MSKLGWLLVAALAGHGLIHLLGAFKGFGWAEVSQLTTPIGTAEATVWLAAAVLVIAAAALLAVRAPRWWWLLAAVAAAVSQIAISTSWQDARAGTLVNIVLLIAAAVHGCEAGGPRVWHGGRSETSFTYLEPQLDTIGDDVDAPEPTASTPPSIREARR
ncbi:hypothetical protein [Nocardioides zhouii]|uniref:DoxX family protein n=1 Tax=Nocardioides zhouii TaxID=1168729 RepID=A0A4V1RQM4_9ACTN|nr:hypothetical protein [Nocardioides zhouii]RYC13367.1 hypothetical protein EUA94_05735 [Nocardioides zhouii]